MANVLHWLVPKELEFFDMLKEQSENAVNGAREFGRLVVDYPKLSYEKKLVFSENIKRLEKNGDEITHNILAKLDKTFITPIDKEDIHSLVMLLDDVTDLIDSVSRRFVIFGIEKVDTFVKRLSENVLKAVIEVDSGILELKKLRNMKEFYVRLHAIENESDEIYHNALRSLFKNKKNAVDIIKYKEIYEFLEQIADKCEDIANVIESVVVKHA